MYVYGQTDIQTNNEKDISETSYCKAMVILEALTVDYLK